MGHFFVYGPLRTQCELPPEKIQSWLCQLPTKYILNLAKLETKLWQKNVGESDIL